MNNVDLRVKRIVVETCLTAVWTDGIMTSGERRYISHLIESLAENEEERIALGDLRFQERSVERVHSEIAQLSPHEKTYVMDTCVEILASDRVLNRNELHFLSDLRKACGMDSRTYRRRLSKLRKRLGVRMTVGATMLTVAAMAMFSSAAVLVPYSFLYAADIGLTEESNGKAILVSVFEQDDENAIETKAAEDVFSHIRDSIVRVIVFVGNEPVSGGSGAVIGTDESGLVYIVTNRHVIHNERTEQGVRGKYVWVEVEQHSGAKFNAKLDFYSREHDIALLSVQGMEPYSRPLELILKEDLRVGEAVYAAGTPISLKHTFTAGVVSALRDEYLQTDATVHSGSSGGPLVNGHGDLAAIMTSSYNFKNYSFGIYADMLLEVLEEREAHLASLQSESRAEQSAN